MRRPLARPRGLGSAILWDLLTFEKLMTAQVVHLIYWSGLAIRSADLISVLTAIPVAVGGLLVMAVLVLLWRSLCEFYVAIFKISEDLSVLRADVEAERARVGEPRG